MMNKVSTCPNHRFYMQTNQIMQNPNEKREKRGVPRRGRRGKRRRGERKDEEGKGRLRRGREGLDDV